MTSRATRFLLASLALIASGQVAEACHKCKKNPCVMAPPPAACAAPMPTVECVTEMVPYTTYRTITRTAYQAVQETIMVPMPETTYVERQRIVCKPVYETSSVQRSYIVTRPVTETRTVTEQFTVAKPVSIVRQVTEYCMQPYTSYMTVPMVQKCGHCGKAKAVCGCATVARTCYTPVPTIRDVVETQYVPEVQSRQVNVNYVSYVSETKTETIPVRTCRIVQEVVTDRIPVTRMRPVPKVITRQIPYPVHETIAQTCYRPVQRMVAIQPAVYAAPQAAPMSTPTPSSQAAASKQG